MKPQKLIRFERWRERWLVQTLKPRTVKNKCWLYQGYPIIWFEGMSFTVQRLIFFTENLPGFMPGQLLQTHYVTAMCEGGKKCVNPEHLAVVHRKSDPRNLRHLKHVQLLASNSPGMRLRRERAYQILTLAREGLTYREIAEKLKCSPSAVKRCVLGQTWQTAECNRLRLKLKTLYPPKPNLSPFAKRYANR